MTRRERRLLTNTRILAVLMPLLLVAVPTLGWSASYHCLVTGADLAECCCAPATAVVDSCCETEPTCPGLAADTNGACDCCEVLLTRHIPAEPTSSPSSTTADAEPSACAALPR